jgi:uncharacterized protein YcfJ
MNKILFLLGMVFCLDASARVAVVAENNNYTVTEDHSGAEAAPLEYAIVIDAQHRFKTVATRGVCRQLDDTGRQVCEPGRVISREHIGYDVTYKYKDFVGTVFLDSMPPAGIIYMKTVITPIVK